MTTLSRCYSEVLNAPLPMKTELKHTPEPWVAEPYLGRILNNNGEMFFNHIDRDSDREAADSVRVVQCVNACAGIQDPAEAIRKAKEALQAVVDVWAMCVQPVTLGAQARDTLKSVGDGLSKANDLAKEAVSLLTPKASA